MGKLGRRDFLRAAVATTGGVVVSGAFDGLLASAAGAAQPSSTLAPVPDLRDGAVRLWLPSGFQYRSFHDTEFTITLDDGTALPGRHDGMAATRSTTLGRRSVLAPRTTPPVGAAPRRHW